MVTSKIDECNTSNEESAHQVTGDQGGGYLMLKSLHAEKFRCFRDLELEDLRRVNIIVGDNASGKTALLETLKMGLDGTPSSIPWMDQLRTIPCGMPLNPTEEQFRAQFIEFFYGFDTDATIIIEIKDSNQRTANVRIHFDPKAALTVPSAAEPIGFRVPAAPPVPAQPITIVPLAFERTDFQGRRSILIVTVNAQGQTFIQPGPPLGIVSSFVYSQYCGAPGENASWLSKLSVEKGKPWFLEAVRRHFPLIRDLTSETPMPGITAIYADLAHLPRKIPLSLVSGGISRLVTIILAIVAYRNGVVLIDEVENGLFHSRFPMVWKTILDLAKRYETQLFISTHSNECLMGAVEAMASDPESFALLRVRRADGSSMIDAFRGKQIEAALEKGGEVRD